MSEAAAERYNARMRRVLDHVDRHLDGDLSLNAVADVAAFSKHHFHRQFLALFGVSVHRYVQLARIKQASYRLAYRDAQPVTEIALDAGYEAPEAFARAFRQRIGQSPSEFREAPDWEAWRTALRPHTTARSQTMTDYSADDVTIREVPATPVAFLAHHGDPSRLGDTIRRFIAWRKAAGLPPKVSPTFTVFHDPEPADALDFRIDLCAGTDREIPAGSEAEPGLIPAGRCAVLRVTGSSDDLSAPANFLYRDWLPASGEEPRDFPLYCQRISFFPEVAERDAVTELFLPLK